MRRLRHSSARTAHTVPLKLALIALSVLWSLLLTHSDGLCAAAIGDAGSLLRTVPRRWVVAAVLTIGVVQVTAVLWSWMTALTASSAPTRSASALALRSSPVHSMALERRTPPISALSGAALPGAPLLSGPRVEEPEDEDEADGPHRRTASIQPRAILAPASASALPEPIPISRLLRSSSLPLAPYSSSPFTALTPYQSPLLSASATPHSSLAFPLPKRRLAAPLS